MKKSKKTTEKWIRNKTDEAAIEEGCWFDPASADHVCEFFSRFLRHSKGEWANKQFELIDWEGDLLSRMFGWKRPDGTRRFRQAGVWLPKKNGKSSLASGISLYTLCADGEPAAEIYSCASSLENGRIIFNEARAMVESSPSLRRILEVIPSTKRIVFPKTRSYYQVLSSNSASAEGWNIHACLFDELHRQKDDQLFAALRWGGSARRQPLCPITISTAGVYDLNSIAWRQWQYAKDVEAGIKKDTAFLPFISAADPEDDWTSEATWKKANPSLGITISLEDFRRDFNEAKSKPSEEPAFKRYRLNLWTQALTTWIPDDIWMSCNGPVDDSGIKWLAAGLDLASSLDITAFVLIGIKDGRYYLKPFFWICEKQAEQRQNRDGVLYQTWVDKGFVRKTDGNYVDQERIRQDILKICEEHGCKTIAVDRWNSAKIIVELGQDGLDVCFRGQGMKDMSGPTKELERLVYAGLLNHGGNPVLRWMVGNVFIEMDAAANVKPNKKKSKEKIDGVVAAVMALALVMTDSGPSIYETPGNVLVLG